MPNWRFVLAIVFAKFNLQRLVRHWRRTWITVADAALWSQTAAAAAAAKTTTIIPVLSSQTAAAVPITASADAGMTSMPAG